MFEAPKAVVTPRIWAVGALCRAIADALEARFNPVAVRGEISGYARASSGHSYFSLKDETGQIRCAMFRRAAGLLDFVPRDGELVELRGRVALYEARGDLQLIVESMTRAGQGAWFERFLQLKTKLEGEGLFDPARKRALPPMPHGIGLVTSLGAAALHDVATCLQRRVPHIPVWLAPASVQGVNAPAELVAALTKLYQLAPDQIDVILLVRGGGAMEDLWAFNDERVARTLAQSPVPIVTGVGHETDFTIADFVADLRAPTPTAAAELVAQPQVVWQDALELMQERLQAALLRHLDQQSQRLDIAASRLGRPSVGVAAQRLAVSAVAQRLRFAASSALGQKQRALEALQISLPLQVRRSPTELHQRLDQAGLRLGLLDPALVLQRGYAWVTTQDGQTISRVGQTQVGQTLLATLADGRVDLTVTARRSN